MKKYVVARDRYMCPADEDSLQIDLIEAANDNAAAIQAMSPKGYLYSGAEDDESALETLNRINGDGMDYIKIVELMPDGTLRKVN